MARIQLRDTTIYIQDGLAGTAAVDDVAGVIITDTDVEIDTIVLNTDETDLVPVNARFQFPTADTTYTVTARTPASTAPTTNIVFTPAATAIEADSAVITFFPQRVEVKIGDGDLSWTEARNFEYDLDRDLLDTVRQGEDIPVSVDLAFTFEYVTTESGKAITPVDAVKGTGGADEWVSSSSDLCEPYAVDIYVIHDIPCGTDQDQDFLLPDFRFESLDYSIADASIAVSGNCNVTDIVTTRAADIT